MIKTEKLKKRVKYKTVDKRSYFRITIGNIISIHEGIYYAMDYFRPMNIQNILFKV
ncbi:hypothetical protein H8356DRAFT_1425134 [Neocallimastix lanati (nom. inval.)]|nr:hypothetical protein H8356DRAFT_1434444 [Neocallimastix sp. JGI-2020a]KAG4098050.1 hypothetical protein H8356DRAFT_1425134 [Neocallimastix sp. JGI-2020a]